MRRLFVILMVICHAMGIAAAVRFLSVENPVVTDAGVNALEVRVAQRDARVGSNGVRQWHLSWADVAVDVIFDFRNFVEGVDVPKVKIQCAGVAATLDRGFDADGGYNTLALEWDPDGTVTVLFGERELYPVMVLNSLARPVGPLMIAASKGGDIDVADVIVEVPDNDISRLMTDYSADQLADAPKLRYLDRENDPKLANIGGRYTLARIGNDLIYIDGAKTNATHWQFGMLKGRLLPTGYVGYYHLLWYDATGRCLSEDCYAEVDEKLRIVKFVFPTLSASLRFAF